MPLHLVCFFIIHVYSVSVCRKCWQETAAPLFYCNNKKSVILPYHICQLHRLDSTIDIFLDKILPPLTCIMSDISRSTWCELNLCALILNHIESVWAKSWCPFKSTLARLCQFLLSIAWDPLSNCAEIHDSLINKYVAYILHVCRQLSILNVVILFDSRTYIILWKWPASDKTDAPESELHNQISTKISPIN